MWSISSAAISALVFGSALASDPNWLRDGTDYKGPEAVYCKFKNARGEWLERDLSLGTFATLTREYRDGNVIPGYFGWYTSTRSVYEHFGLEQQFKDGGVIKMSYHIVPGVVEGRELLKFGSIGIVPRAKVGPALQLGSVYSRFRDSARESDSRMARVIGVS